MDPWSTLNRCTRDPRTCTDVITIKWDTAPRRDFRQSSSERSEIRSGTYEVKELIHVDVTETLLSFDLIGTAYVLIFCVPVATAGANSHRPTDQVLSSY